VPVGSKVIHPIVWVAF